MNEMLYRIKSEASQDEILERLKKVTIENQPFVKPKGIKFLGTINYPEFKLITFHAPPMEFDFKLLGDQIYFGYKKKSFVPDMKALIYALLLPLFLGLILFAILSDDFNLYSRITLTLTLTFIFYFCIKLYPFLYKKFVLPDDEKFMKSLKEALKVEFEQTNSLSVANAFKLNNGTKNLNNRKDIHTYT